MFRVETSVSGLGACWKLEGSLPFCLDACGLHGYSLCIWQLTWI